MAYKYLNDDGLKAYTKKVKGALKDLHTPIAISTENTTESKAQNVRNIANFVAKAKAAGIADVNGMAVTCIIDDGFSGVGYLYGNTDIIVSGIITFDDGTEPYYFLIQSDGFYSENIILMGNSQSRVTSSMLTKGARKPIILTPETTEVDEGTYQKLMSDNVDVVFIASDGEYCALTYKEDATSSKSFYFTCLSTEGGDTMGDIYIYAYGVNIVETKPHTCTITAFHEGTILDELIDTEFVHKGYLSLVLQEIDLTGTDAERKAKLDKFEIDWKALTGASDLTGARFVGKVQNKNDYNYSGVFVWNSISNSYEATVGYGSDGGQDSSPIAASVIPSNGTLFINPLALDAEVTEMLDAIKYSYTPVPLTATTSTNKTQLDLFLSKVPNAQVMHVTYKDVYAGTLHKIGTDWFGLLVKNTNNYEDAIQVKLQADGTLIEGTTSLAQVNTKLDNIIG